MACVSVRNERPIRISNGDRARLVQPDLPLTDENIRAIDAICQKVDGLPLAIELAAARTRFLSPTALCERLTERLSMLVGGPRDVPERHRTLRATLAWSYDLLNPDERVLFRRLGVAVNGIPYDAVDPICNSGGDLDHRVPELLDALIDHSLVRIDDHPDTGPRVRMLHTVREFAHEQLVLSGEVEAVQRAHAMWYARMVIDTPITTWGTGRPELRQWTLRHIPDLQTFSTVLTRLMDWGEHTLVLGMTSQLVSFWNEIGHYREPLEWTRRLMPYAEGVSTESKAHFLFKAALVLHMSDHIDEAQELATRSLALFDEIGDARWISNLQNMLGNLQWQIGNHEDGERYHRMAIATSASNGNEIGVAMFKPQLADRLVEHKRFAEAEQLLDEAFPIIERERPDATPLVLGSKALLYLRTDRVSLAGEAMRRALTYYESPPHRRPDLLAEMLMFTADLAARRGIGDEGTMLLGTAEKIVDDMGMKLNKDYHAEEDRIRSALREMLDPERFDGLRRQGQVMPTTAAIGLAMEVCERIAATPAAPVRVDAEDDLTPREREVLRLLVEGKSNAEIADELFISQRTVTTHLTRLYAKLEVTSRTAAISAAIRMGIVNPS